MKKTSVIATVTLALVLLALAFWKPWCFAALGLLALGVAGYVPSIGGLQVSRRTSWVLLLLFVSFSLGQIVLQWAQEKDAHRAGKLLAAALTDKQVFPFRVVVEPNRTPHFPVNVGDPVFRPFYSSRGPGVYTRFMNLGGGDTVQSVSERPNIAPLFATFVLNNPPVEPLTPPFKFGSVDGLVLDVAEMAMNHWLLTVGASVVQTDFERVSSGARSECPTIRSIQQAFTNNHFIEYLADAAEHRSVTRSVVTYPKTSACLGELSSDTSVQDAVPERVIAVVGPSFHMRVCIRHEGQTKLEPQEVNDLGILLKYNDVDLPFVMTEDFRITVAITQRDGSSETGMFIHDLVSMMRRDFDWIVYKDTLLLTRER